MPSDEVVEIFDVVNERDEVVGMATRSECHANPQLIHRAVVVLVFDTNGQLILQKRSQSKDLYPGMWTLSATGHVDQGERYAVAAQREVVEELGIRPVLHYCDKFLFNGDQETEFNAVYAAVHDGQVNPNDAEIVQVTRLPIGKILTELRSGMLEMTPAASEIMTRLEDGRILLPATLSQLAFG